MEPLDVDKLYLAATRPALFMGVPIVMAALMLMAVGLIVVLLKNPLYLVVMVPVWFAARARGGRGYHAAGGRVLVLRRGARAGRARLHRGPCSAPLPPPRRALRRQPRLGWRLGHDPPDPAEAPRQGHARCWVTAGAASARPRRTCP